MRAQAHWSRSQSCSHVASSQAAAGSQAQISMGPSVFARDALAIVFGHRLTRSSDRAITCVPKAAGPPDYRRRGYRGLPAPAAGHDDNLLMANKGPFPRRHEGQLMSQASYYLA